MCKTAPGTENLPRKHIVTQSGERRSKSRLTRSKSSTMHHSSSSSSSYGNNNQSEKPATTTTQTTTTTLTTDMTDQGPVPQQPKLSRATQKPHVRKNRRQSSMERRRARYARLDAQGVRTILILD